MTDNTDATLELIIQQGLDISPDCFGILDCEDKVVFCNSTFASAYGVIKEEALGKTNKELLRFAWENKKGIVINTDDFEAWYQRVEALQAKKELNQFETDFTNGRWFKMTRTNLKNGYIILHGVDITDLKEAQKALEKANKRIEALANTDPLTGINNRRAFKSISKREIKRAKRYQQQLSVLIMDLDRFKQINDHYGHDCGDYILHQFASLCTQQLRESDSIFRIGGEEFAILLPMTDKVGAYNIAERIRSSIMTHEFYYEELNQYIGGSVSIGIGYLKDPEQSFEEIMIQADEALYKAKKNGRNQTVIFCHELNRQD